MKYFLSEHLPEEYQSIRDIRTQPICRTLNTDVGLHKNVKYIRLTTTTLKKIINVQSSITSVTSNTWEGIMRGYILKFFPNLGICIIRQGGTSLSLIPDI